MKVSIGLSLTIWAASLVHSGPAIAQTQTLDGSAATGQQQYVNGPTGYQSQEYTNNVPADVQGQTWTTGGQTQGFGGRGPNLGTVGTKGLAANSVNQTPLPSGAFSDGFPAGAQSTTSDSYTPQGLPLTSTSSMDLNTADCPYCGQGPSPIWGW